MKTTLMMVSIRINVVALNSIRMRYGEPLENECVNGVFVIGGPMKG
jgi:hypothetical protein